MERIVPDYAVKINLTTGGDFLMSPRYDSIHRFKWLGVAILRVISEDGMMHIHVDTGTAQLVSEATKIPITDYEFMCETDHEAYVKARTDSIEELFGADFEDGTNLDSEET